MSRNLKNVNYNDDYDESEDELSKEKSTLFQEFEQRVEFLTTQTNQLQPQQSQQVQQQQIMPNQLHQNQPMNMRQLHQNQLMQQIPMQIPQHNQFFLGFDVPKIFQSVPMQKHQEVNLLMHNITNGLIPSNEFVARLQLLMNGGNQKVIPIMPNPTSNFQIKIEKDQKRPQPVENNSIPPPKRVKQNSRPTSKTQAPMPKLATPNPNTESGASTPQPASASVKEVDLDLEGMMDVTNYAGVNLKDEESALNDMGTGGGVREKFKHMPFLDTELVEERLFELGALYGIEDVDETLANFISCAAELYATRLLEQMCKIADHRMATDYTTLASFPSLKSNSEWVLEVETVDDVRQTLLDMEAVERQEENQLLATVGPRPNPDDEMQEDPTLQSAQQSSSSKKKAGPRKDLPEAVKNKLANQAVQMAIGGTQKSWMNAGGTSFGSRPGSLPAQKQTPVALGPGVLSNIPPGARAGPKRISIKDALIVVENRKELRTSELLYKWYANIK